MKRRANGFGLLAYLLAGIALAGLIGTGVYKVKQWGADEVRAEWAAANLRAAQQAEKDRLAREAEAKKVIAAQHESDRKARDYEAKWRQARNALRDVPLAVPSCPLPAAPGAPAGDPGKPSGPLMLTWAFSLQWDAAWADQAGKPVFPDTRDPASRPPAASAAVSLDAALDNHAENASRCSQNARQLGALIGLIRKLQAPHGR